jgi:ribA/ribD-fused uncharacterized protein
MMAEKARLFGDQEAVGAILAASTPKKAKTLGRKVSNFDVATWDAHCREIVTRGNVEKFRQNADLLVFLLATEGTVLVEASPYDKIWGIGMRQSDPRAMNPVEWQGANLLGFALMDVRAQLSGNDCTVQCQSPKPSENRDRRGH